MAVYREHVVLRWAECRREWVVQEVVPVEWGALVRRAIRVEPGDAVGPAEMHSVVVLRLGWVVVADSGI